ncbi:MAG: hypothetical protein R3A12_13880 [Ignavibacteria bacterium]
MNLVNETQTAGNYSVNFNGINLASGMFFTGSMLKDQIIRTSLLQKEWF